ncbi:MAG: glycine cleavage system aminomethyltransferase GcvT [Tepidisphaerales bacterium]
MLKRTPLYEFHKNAGARFVDFAGWEMPLLYNSIVGEHEQTRASGGLFDVSHMGRLSFKGPDADAFLNHVVTRNLADQAVGQSRYSLVCNEDGGVLDDVIVSRDAKNWMMVCNASNREKLVGYFHEVRQEKGFDFDMGDNTEATAMLAIQGPKALDRIASIIDARNIKRYHFEHRTIMALFQVTVFRSGYTGEDGVELIISSKLAGMATKAVGAGWEKHEATIKPVGLGARDTLRMEASMPLYGHELNETTDPLSAGLAWAVSLDKDFVGADALRKIHDAGLKRKLVGLELEGKRIARPETPVMLGGRQIGQVTSGTFSPTLQKSIAMAYVEAGHAGVGTKLDVDLKGAMNAAVVVKMPFYKRAK